MIKVRNDLESMFWHRIPLAKPGMAALRQALKEKPEVEPFYIQEVAEAFEGQWKTWKDEILLQAYKFFLQCVVLPARRLLMFAYEKGTRFPQRTDCFVAMSSRMGETKTGKRLETAIKRHFWSSKLQRFEVLRCRISKFNDTVGKTTGNKAKAILGVFPINPWVFALTV